MRIQVLGTGCARCRQLTAGKVLSPEAVKELLRR